MKKYLMIFSAIVIVGCSNIKTEEELALEAAEQEQMMQQGVIDSLVIEQQANAISESDNSEATSEESEEKEGMNNKTKGALIGTGTGIVVGATTGALVSEKKGKGAVTGGLVGGALGFGVGYGLGARKDNKEAEK